MSKIIQFLHPGKYDRRESTIAWNCSKHKRKLIRNEISYIDNGVLNKSNAGYFWGEWEPESECVKENEAYVHTLKYPSNITANQTIKCNSKCESKNKLLQNTDPYVFGDYFIYSNCLQTTYSELQNLNKNDIILFGSRSGGQFILDTLFVVDRELQPDEIISDCFRKATYRFICSQNYKIYKAKMYNPEKPKELYSFFPCYSSPFPRPAIELKYIHSNNRGVCYIHKHSPELKSIDVWNDIVGIIKQNGLYVGVWAKEPEEA